MNVFVDTSAFYAALSKTDANYAKAISDWNALMDDEQVRFCTSNYVIVETCALVRNRLGNDAVRSFLDSLLPLAMVIWVDQNTHKIATAAMLAQGKNRPSLVDCSSFAIMRDNNIDKALAYDKHFLQEGFAL
ncbi:MAG: PIN domain-containing protein [Armatimonadetes bacterium]|nr:PIN domain-containing protein [Armatimonadota bacterium]